MNKLLLAIPHSSAVLGRLETSNPLLGEIRFEALNHADLYTDELFYLPGAKRVLSPLSRYSVDVERFWDNDKEVCYAKGQGKFYTRLNSGKQYRSEQEIPVSYKRVYWEYHWALQEYIDAKQADFLVDCHSFNDPKREYADICLGWNEDETKPAAWLIDKICACLKEAGLSVSFNTPYCGSMTVSSVQPYKSLMIEVNKNLYLADNWGKHTDFDSVRRLITSVLQIIERG